MDWQRAVEFVRRHFEAHDPTVTELTERYPFRKRFDHCLRCSAWARRIAVAEHADVQLAETAALFHDIGKTKAGERQLHGALGADICGRYLTSIGYDEGRRAVIVGIVARHSQHARDAKATLEEKIVSDADLLDETGAIGVLWDAMACALEPGPSYETAYERILRMTLRTRSWVPERLHTAEAKRIAQARFAIVDRFLADLGYELGHEDSPARAQG